MVKSLGLSIIAMFLTASLAEARVNIAHTVPMEMPVTRTRNGVWTKDIGKIVPANELKTIDPERSDDAGFVFGRIGDKALQYWLASPEVQGSAMGRTATTVDKAMKTEVNVKSTGNSKNKVDHKIAFQVQALQSSTKLEYKGWVNAAWDYDARDRASRVQVSERIFKNKDLTISHTASKDEDVSAMGIRWSW